METNVSTTDTTTQKQQAAVASRRGQKPVPQRAQPDRPRPERIQERLKPDRVQEKLAQMPGWVLDLNSLMAVYSREFEHSPSRSAYAGFVQQVARDGERELAVACCGQNVILCMPLRHGCSSGLTTADVALAQTLALRT